MVNARGIQAISFLFLSHFESKMEKCEIVELKMMTRFGVIIFECVEMVSWISCAHTLHTHTRASHLISFLSLEQKELETFFFQSVTNSIIEYSQKMHQMTDDGCELIRLSLAIDFQFEQLVDRPKTTTGLRLFG